MPAIHGRLIGYCADNMKNRISIAFCLMVLAGCQYGIYEQKPHTYRVERGTTLAIAPACNGRIYLLNEGVGDYVFPLENGHHAEALQQLVEDGRIRQILPGNMCSINLFAVTTSQLQPATAAFELYFPPHLLENNQPMPPEIKRSERDYPIARHSRDAALQRGLTLPANGRLPYLQTRLNQGRTVQLFEHQRNEILRRDSLMSPVTICLHRQKMQRTEVGREAWLLKIM